MHPYDLMRMDCSGKRGGRQHHPLINNVFSDYWQAICNSDYLGYELTDE